MSAQTAWERSGGKAELFDSARIATQLLYNDLSAAFYGEEYDSHMMGDAAGKFIFYKTETDSDNKVHLTFATMRGAESGLTEVNYVWNPADLMLSVQALSETSADPVPSLGASGWVNFPSNAWISDIRAKGVSEIADNILMFEVQNFYYNNSDDPPNDSARYRPPAMVLVTFAALSSAGYEKLETMMKAVKPDASDSDINTAIVGFFNNMRKEESGKKLAEFNDDAVQADDSGVFQAVSLPAKQVLLDNVQFFKIMVSIERD